MQKRFGLGLAAQLIAALPVIAVLSGQLQAQVHAETSADPAASTVFNYDGFYARMKKSEKPEYSEVTLTFILQQRGNALRCDVDKAEITTDISKDPLTVASNGELILPYDELYNQRKALIRIYQKPNAVPCDLNFRLRNKMPLSSELSLGQLRTLHQQFDALLKDLAGMGKYFLPDMTGVTLQFDSENPVVTPLATSDTDVAALSAALATAAKCSKQQCQLDLSQISQVSNDVKLRFSQTPSYISPLISRQ